MVEKKGDKITLLGINYEVIKRDNRWYLENKRFNKISDNDAIFTKLGISDASKISIKILGYSRGGVFPECDTINDLNKLIRHLQRLINPIKIYELW